MRNQNSIVINTEYEVAVCGGGLAAARAGKKVILFERQYMLSGLAPAFYVSSVVDATGDCDIVHFTAV